MADKQDFWTQYYLMFPPPKYTYSRKYPTPRPPQTGVKKTRKKQDEEDLQSKSCQGGAAAALSAAYQTSTSDEKERSQTVGTTT